MWGRGDLTLLFHVQCILYIYLCNIHISRAIFLDLKNTFVSRDHHVTSTL